MAPSPRLAGYTEKVGAGEGHHNPDQVKARAEGASAPDVRRRGMEVLSWDPRVFLYRGILTDGARLGHVELLLLLLLLLP